MVHENKPITKRTVEGIKPIECDRDQNRLEVNCRICGKTFPKKSHLQRHIKEVHETPITKRTVESVNSIDCDRDQNRHEVNCSICGKTFPKKSRLQRHITVVHEKKPITKRTAEGIKGSSCR